MDHDLDREILSRENTWFGLDCDLDDFNPDIR